MKTNAESTSLSDGSIQSYVIIRGPQLYGQRTLLMNMIIFFNSIVSSGWQNFLWKLDWQRSKYKQYDNVNHVKKKFAELLLKHLVVFILLRIDT